MEYYYWYGIQVDTDLNKAEGRFHEAENLACKKEKKNSESVKKEIMRNNAISSFFSGFTRSNGSLYERSDLLYKPNDFNYLT